MNRFKTYGLVGLCGVGVVATLDSAFGLGGSALIADICRTWLEDETAPGGMGDMPMEVKPVPLIAISMSATGAAIWALMRDQQKAATGRSAPDDEERAAILSAMLIAAAAQGRATRQEFADIFRIVTYHELEPDLLELSFSRFRGMLDEDLTQYRMSELSTSIGRRRALAAALLMGCVARETDDRVNDLIDRLAQDIGATPDDIAAAHKALDEWTTDMQPVQGVSPVTLLRHRNLPLTPA